MEIVEFDQDELIHIPKGDISSDLAFNPFVPPAPGMIRAGDHWQLAVGPRLGLRWEGQGKTEALKKANRRSANWIRFSEQPPEIQNEIIQYLIGIGVISNGPVIQVDDGVRTLKRELRRARDGHVLIVKRLEENWLPARDKEWKLIGHTENKIEVWETEEAALATSDWGPKDFFIVGLWENGLGWTLGMPREMVPLDFSLWSSRVRDLR